MPVPLFFRPGHAVSAGHKMHWLTGRALPNLSVTQHQWTVLFKQQRRRGSTPPVRRHVHSTHDDPSHVASRRAAELNSAVFRRPVMFRCQSRAGFPHTLQSVTRRISSCIAAGHMHFSRGTEPGHPTSCGPRLPGRTVGETEFPRSGKSEFPLLIPPDADIGTSHRLSSSTASHEIHHRTWIHCMPLTTLRIRCPVNARRQFWLPLMRMSSRPCSE